MAYGNWEVSTVRVQIAGAYTRAHLGVKELTLMKYSVSFTFGPSLVVY